MTIGSVGSNNRNLNKTLEKQSKTFDQLSSGKRITKASDDAAGLAVAAALENSARVLGQASRNVSDISSFAQIGDSALSQVSEIGTRLKELSVQASNGTLSDEQRGALNQEYQALTQEAQRITESTEFNGKKVLTSEGTSVQVGTGSDSNSQITITGTDISGSISQIAAQDISTQAGAQNALEAVDNLISSTASARGELGSAVSRTEVAANNISTERENSIAAASRITDADFASLVAEKVSNNILTQSATAISAQANQSAQVVLKLLG